jgi:acetolactate synthase-1/2/3 large subunit
MSQPPQVPRYSDAVVDWLCELGYTHCFFVAGGNIMHLLNAARTRLTCVAFVHEVAAGIAAEYFNAIAQTRRAVVLVTAGPGVTNIVTSLAGAYLESRELLVLGGQVKSTDLAGSLLRQRGIQEIDGVEVARSVTVVSERIEQPVDRSTFVSWVERGRKARKGPVFLEICLDAQGAPHPSGPAGTVEPLTALGSTHGSQPESDVSAAAIKVAAAVRAAQRPVLLLGGGFSWEASRTLRTRLQAASVAVMTTWNGADRADARDENYFGRPNTWGQRSANVLLQQADLIVAIGTRLGLQQTGFNYGAFAPLARVAQVEIDQAELEKGHPSIWMPILGDADAFTASLLEQDLGTHEPWLTFARDVRQALPLAEEANVHIAPFIDPFVFMHDISELCTATDTIVPCSSGGAFTTAMQAFEQRFGQRIVTNKGLASMGYGLAGAIGAAIERAGSRVILFEGDGGFSQGLQELATVGLNELPIKIFIMSNAGYASIRMTQRGYFQGAYIGCDVESGLGFPRWDILFAAYGIRCMNLAVGWAQDERFLAEFADAAPSAFIVPIDPEQTYFPKITSRITENGSMESAPLHLMTPDLEPELANRVFRYLMPEHSPK